MGYCVTQEEAEFFIAKEDFQRALVAIQDLHGKETCNGSSGAHFSWVIEDFYKIDNLKDMLEDWNLEPYFNEQGDISSLYFAGEKLGDEALLFAVIAPFVKDGSYIQMRGEDGAAWRWEFKNGKMTERNAKRVWE